LEEAGVVTEQEETTGAVEIPEGCQVIEKAEDG
jgi:hypothetical protein